MSGSLVIQDLHVMRGTQHVLRGVSLDVNPGQISVLMGLSGAGKSTVLRAVAALQPFSSGAITVGDVALQPGPLPPESKLKPLRRTVGFVFQAHALFEHLTALDNVTLAPIHVLGWTREKAEQVAHALLAELGVDQRADAYPRELSGGQAQRVAIARALAPGPNVLLMDEPTSALDPARRSALGETLREVASNGRGLLISTHDVDFARGFADETIVLANGVVVEEGPAREVLTSPQHAATRALLHGESAAPTA